MTQTSNLKSPQITSRDGTPPVVLNVGEGEAGPVKRIDGYVTALSGDAVGSTYRMVRLPSNCKVKKVILNSAVASAGAADINVAYSDSATDMTAVANQGAIIQMSSANNQLFGAAHSLVAQSQADCTFANTTNFPWTAVNVPLWSVLGLTSDPGGMLDVILSVTTAITTGGLVMLSVDYVE
jgi:hypothetical protein